MTRIMLALLVLCAPALARDNGQYNSVSPEIRSWFRTQKSPKTGALCCNEADGIYAEEDIRNGQYWTRWPGHDWQPARGAGRVVVRGTRRDENTLLCARGRRLEWDDFSSNHHPALTFCLSMNFFRKPVPTFRDHALAASTVNPARV